MEKQLFSSGKMIGNPGYFPSQIIRSIRLLAFTANPILMYFKQSETGFYSFCLTPFTMNLYKCLDVLPLSGTK